MKIERKINSAVIESIRKSRDVSYLSIPHDKFGGAMELRKVQQDVMKEVQGKLNEAEKNEEHLLIVLATDR